MNPLSFDGNLIISIFFNVNPKILLFIIKFEDKLLIGRVTLLS